MAEDRFREASTSPGESDEENDIRQSSPSPVIQTKSASVIFIA